MARIRSIKPDIWDDDRIDELSRDARLLFIGLITQADDEGYLQGRPQWVKSKVYPGDEDLTKTEVSGWLDELNHSGLIWCYEHEGKPYIWLPNWEKHQSIDKRYKQESKLPRAPQERPTSTPRGPDEDETQEWSGEERSGGDRRGEDGAGKPAVRSLFPDWLAHYHLTTGRTSVTGSKTARDAFSARIKDGKTLDDLKLATVGCHGDQFCRDNGHDVPETILRAGKVERYISLARDRKATTSTSSPGMDNAKRRAEMVRRQQEERTPA